MCQFAYGLLFFFLGCLWASFFACSRLQLQCPLSFMSEVKVYSVKKSLRAEYDAIEVRGKQAQ